MLRNLGFLFWRLTMLLGHLPQLLEDYGFFWSTKIRIFRKGLAMEYENPKKNCLDLLSHLFL